LPIDQSIDISVTINPSNASIKTLAGLFLPISGNDYATVEQISNTVFKVTGVAKGVATLNIMTSDGSNVVARVYISVTKGVTGIDSAQTSFQILPGYTAQITCNVLPPDASDKKILYSSDDASIATVSSAGIITGVATGFCNVSATTEDGAYSKTFNVTVSSFAWADFDFFQPGATWDYVFVQGIYQNLIYLYNSLVNDYGYIITALTSITDFNGYKTAQDKIQTIINTIEDNIYKITTGIDFYIIYGLDGVVAWADATPTIDDLNRWIGFCNFLKIITDLTYPTVQKLQLETNEVVQMADGSILLVEKGLING
jgi:hypothetical protein